MFSGAACVLIYIQYTAISVYVVSSLAGKTCSGPHWITTKLSAVLQYTGALDVEQSGLLHPSTNDVSH